MTANDLAEPLTTEADDQFDSPRSRSGSDTSSGSDDSSASTKVHVKRIGLFGSIALLTNNVTGGGMVLFAQLYQQAGWFVPTIALLFLMGCTGLASLFLVELMSMMPGNGRFNARVEYSGVMKHFCSKPIFVLSFLFYQLSLLCTNISLIVQSVQVVDFALVAIFDRSCLVPSLWPEFAFKCPDAVTDNITPFSNDVYGITLGLLITVILILPLGFVNLDDNILVQKIAFFILAFIICTWSVLFVEHGLEPMRTPLFGSTYSNVMGVCLFNFAFLSSVPSWINDKRDSVRVSHALLGSLPTSVLMFVLVGFLCGMSFKPWTDGTNLLDRVFSLRTPLAHITFYAFPIVANLTSIPVTSIFQRLNLIEQGCPVWAANIIAVILPWVIAIPLYSGDGFQELSTWSGLLVTSAVNFVFPPAVYAWVSLKDVLEARRKAREEHALHHIHLLHTDSRADDAIVNLSPSLLRSSALDEVHAPFVSLDDSADASEIQSHCSDSSGGTVSVIEHVESDSDRWQLFDVKHSHWRLPVSASLLVAMVVLCIGTLAISIQQAVQGSLTD